MNAPIAMYQFKWISFEVYNFSLLVPFILVAVIFERMRWAARDLKEDQSGNEVVYWRRQISDKHGEPLDSANDRLGRFFKSLYSWYAKMSR